MQKKVYSNLLKTYQNPDSMTKWWEDIFIEEYESQYRGGGGSMPGKPTQVKVYNGWFISFISGGINRSFAADRLTSGYYKESINGVSSCPMKIVDTIRKIEDNSVLIGGMLGFKVHHDSPNKIDTLEPFHGWAMLLPPNSPLRSK